jgi:hypothetical protein
MRCRPLRIKLVADELVPAPVSSMTSVREGVEVEPAPCGSCGKMTVSRIESPNGKIGCLECFLRFLGSGAPRLPGEDQSPKKIGEF